MCCSLTECFEYVVFIKDGPEPLERQNFEGEGAVDANAPIDQDL